MERAAVGRESGTDFPGPSILMAARRAVAYMPTAKIDIFADLTGARRPFEVQPAVSHVGNPQPSFIPLAREENRLYIK